MKIIRYTVYPRVGLPGFLQVHWKMIPSDRPVGPALETRSNVVYECHEVWYGITNLFCCGLRDFLLKKVSEVTLSLL